MPRSQLNGSWWNEVIEDAAPAGACRASDCAGAGVAEVVNALGKRLITGGVDRARAADVPLASSRLSPELRPIVSLAVRALDIAGELHHPAYGCYLAYLALAEERRTKLVTADPRLMGRLAGTPWQEDAISLWN